MEGGNAKLGVSLCMCHSDGKVYSVHTAGRNGYTYRLNMELDLQRLFGLHVT